MKIQFRTIFLSFLIVAIVYFLALFKLPYYIYKPGSADALDDIVMIENNYESSGNLHLVTVSSGQATPLTYVISQFIPNYELRKIEEMFPEGVEEDEYFETQLHMMESSQEAAIVVGYQKAGAEVNIDYKGVFVTSVMKGFPAEHVLQVKDEIYQIDEKKIERSTDLIDYLKTKKVDDLVTVHFLREGKKQTAELSLDIVDDESGRVGLGIQLVTNRTVEVEPEVTFLSGNIGGSSAGLMFSLEIYDQLTGEDITKGKKIAGTGEIDYEGIIYPIGGVDKKVIAADKAGCEVFFVPNENGKENSNYEVAKKKAEEINTNMKVVPVDHFDDALNYLQSNL